MTISYIDIAILAIIALYFVIGLFKGFIKPLTSMLGWGVSLAGIYFFGGKLNDLLLSSPAGDFFRDFVSKVTDNGELVENIVNYLGLAIVSVGIVIVVAIIVAIINIVLKNSLMLHRKGFWDRFFGGILYLIKGALVVFVLLAIIMWILNLVGATDVIAMFEEGAISKYLVEYNPIKLLFDVIIAK